MTLQYRFVNQHVYAPDHTHVVVEDEFSFQHMDVRVEARILLLKKSRFYDPGFGCSLWCNGADRRIFEFHILQRQEDDWVLFLSQHWYFYDQSQDNRYLSLIFRMSVLFVCHYYPSRSLNRICKILRWAMVRRSHFFPSILHDQLVLFTFNSPELRIEKKNNIKW